MSNQGSARGGGNTPPPTLSGLVSTLVPVLVVSAAYLAVFLVLRKSQKRFYAPRTYLGSLRENERSPPLPDGLFNWIGPFRKIPDVTALQNQSLDAYLFLRFLRMTVVVCFVGCCITWPILFPLNATGGGTSTQLNMLSFSNIGDAQHKRYYGHVFVSWLFFGFVMFLIMRECIYYVNLRQAFLLSPLYSKRISSRTVLFVSVPEPYLDEAKLRKVFGDAVRHVWITCDTEDVDDLVEERDKVAYKLEKAEVELIKLANKARVAAAKKGAGEDNSALPLDTESGSVAARWVPPKKRPHHKTGFLGLVGKKVDTINWCRTELERLIQAAETAQHDYLAGASKKIPSVFIEFRTQADAEAAVQVLAHHQSLHMAPRYIGVTPGEVVWSSLKISWWQRLVRGYVVTAFISALILFWAIPVALVGIISNITFLENLFFLTWLTKIPDVIMGVVTGLLPSVMLSILMSLVPVIMRLCAKLAGEPSLSRVELFTQHWYFIFQVVQVFLITTVASSATAVAKQIADDPSSVTSILSQNLPLASNFYISYNIVQGLTVATSVLTQVVGFAIFAVLYKFLASTPRAMYNKWATLSAISWGSVLPVYTNITVIAIVYAGIAPLILGFSTIGMYLFYLAYRYNILFVTDTKIDTRGLIYPRALRQLFVGIYLGELCMIGLFGTAAAPGPLVLMVAFLVFTVLFHVSLGTAIDPLLENLPMSLLAEENGNLIVDVESPPDGAKHATNGEQNGRDAAAAAAAAAATKKPGNLIARFLSPWHHADYTALKALVPPHAIDPAAYYTDQVGRNAYYPPAVTAPPPLLWIPADAAGVSKQEVAHTSRVIAITDDGCDLDDKGHLNWDRETTRPPVWEEKVPY